MLIQSLIQAGADPNAQTTSIEGGGLQKTALHFLCENQRNLSKETLQALCTGTTPSAQMINSQDADGNTALHVLCSKNLSDGSLSFLLKRKSDPNLKNQFEATPFHEFCQNSSVNLTMLRRMLSSGADPNLPDNVRWLYHCAPACLSDSRLLDSLDPIHSVSLSLQQ